MKFVQILPTLLLLIAGCATKEDRGPRIYYVNSYHPEYGTTAALLASLHSVLPGDSVTLRTSFLDAKRLDSAALSSRATTLADSITAFAPDVLIVSDDNAVQSIVVPNLRRFTFPVVFCGVNWSAEKYSLPADKVTGMIEVLPVRNCIRLLRDSGHELKRITVLSEDSAPEQKNRAAITPQLYADSLEVNYKLVSTFQQWKDAFAEAQQNSDVLFLPTNGAIREWDKKAAISYVRDNIRIPVFTCDDFMMAYASFGFTKVTGEQTRFAANAALAILNGKKTTDIKIDQNKETEFWVNKELIRTTSLNLDTARISPIKHYTYE